MTIFKTKSQITTSSFLIMGKKKPNPKRNHRNNGSKDVADLQKSSDLDVASSGNICITVNNKKSADDDRRNFVVEDSTFSIPDVGLNNATGIEQHDDAFEVANRTTTYSSCSISLPISACGENDEGKSSSSSLYPSSEEKLALALTDEDTSFIGNLSMELNDDHEIETISNGYPTRNTNDHIMQQPFNVFTEEQNQHDVKGVVGGNEEGSATINEEKRVRWTSALKEASSFEDTLEKMNDEHDAIDQSKSDSNSRETSSPRVERSEHNNDQGVTNIIEEEARSDGLKRVRWTATLEEVMTPSTSFDAEDVCGNGMGEQWIRKMIQNIISRSCFCKVVRNDSTTP